MPTALADLSDAQLRALARPHLPLSEWTDAELEGTLRAQSSAEVARTSRPDLSMAETARAAGSGAVEGLRAVGRTVANEPIIRDSIARFTPSVETVATGLDTLPGPVAGAATALTGYGLPAAAAMTGVAAAAGRDAANRLRGTPTGVAEPLAYGATQALAVAAPALGRVTTPAFAANAPRLAAAAEVGAQMGIAGTAGAGATLAYQGASGQELNVTEAAKMGAVSALLGGIGGALRANEVTKLAAADRAGLVQQARTLGFKGQDFDEMRAWYKENEAAADILQKGRQQNARPVGANAPAEEGAMVPRGQIQPLADAPAPAAPMVPRAPVPVAPVAPAAPVPSVAPAPVQPAPMTSAPTAPILQAAAKRPEPSFDDLISGRIDAREVEIYMSQQRKGAQGRWNNLSEQERRAAHRQLGTTNQVSVDRGQFPYDSTPSRFSQVVGAIEAERAPAAAPANQAPKIPLDQQLTAAEQAAARAASRFREAGKWSELKGQAARQRWQVLKSQKLEAERKLEELRGKAGKDLPIERPVESAAPIKPVAEMTDAELIDAAQALTTPPAAPAPAAPGGDLFGDMPFNLASEQQRAPVAPPAPAAATGEMFGSEVRTTAPTALDRANEAARAQAPAAPAAPAPQSRDVLEKEGWFGHGSEYGTRADAERQAGKFTAEQKTREFVVGPHVAGRGTFEIFSRPIARAEAQAPKFTAKVFQGRGASLEQVYGPEAVAQGRAVPILGGGQYYAFNAEDAANYGAVSEQTVALKNPLVIESSAQWYELLKAANAQHLNSRDRLFYAEPAGVAPAADRLKSYVQNKGFDGVVVKNTDREKALRESFGHDTIVSYADLPPGPVAVPAPAARPVEAAANDGLRQTAPVSAGASSPAPAAPEVHTVYDIRGRAKQIPADQPPPLGMVTADQWAELAALKQSSPERFRTRWLRTLNDNARLAKAAARSEKAPAGAVRKERPFAGHPDGETIDLIDHVMDAGGIPRPPKVQRGGEFNGFKDAFQGQARKLIAAGPGGGWDTWVQDLADRAKRPEIADMDPQALAAALDQAFADRRNYSAAGRIEEQEGRFYQASLGQARGSNPGREILAQQLSKGDTLKLDREKFTVAKVDPENGNVTLRDGDKYGTQIVRPDAPLFPDKGTLRGPDGKALKPAKVEDENPFDPGAGGSGGSVAGDPMNPAMPPPPPGTPMGAHSDQRMPVAMERILPGTVDVPTVMTALEKVVAVVGGNAPIRAGRFENDARGIFKSFEDVIRLKQGDNIPTAAHEVAHAISVHIFGGWKSRPLQKALRSSPNARAALAELRTLGKALYGSRVPVAGYPAEGFSELLRLYMTTEAAPTKAPAATKWLEAEILPANPPLAQAVREARDLIDIWRGQGAQGRARAMMKDPPGRLAQLREFAKKRLSFQAQVEEFAPLAELSEGFAKLTGTRLRPANDPFLLATSVRKIAGPVVENMVERGMMDLWGNITGPSLKEALAPVKASQREDFAHYLWARRAIERWGKGKNPGMALEDANYLRTKLETPEFIRAADSYYRWTDGLLEYVKSASPATNGKLIDSIRASSRDYLPLGRAIDPAKARAAAAGAGTASLQRMAGSGLPIKEIYLESLLVAERLVVRAHRDLVMESIFNLATQPGMGWLIERVPRTKVRESINIEKLRAQLEAEGVDTSPIDEDAMLEFTSRMDLPKGIDPIIARRTSTGVEWYQIPANVYELLQGVEAPARLGYVFELLFGGPARLFKLGTTGLNASFALVTNPARDLQTFMLQSIAGTPAKRLPAYFESLAAVVRAGLGGKELPAVALYNQLGISASNYLGGDVQQAKRAAKGLFHGKLWRTVRTPLETAREVMGFTEAVPRVAELGLTAQDRGWKPGQKISPDLATMLRVVAKRITTDFSAAGVDGRQINRAVPFFNAAVQGARGFARRFKNNKGVKQESNAALTAILNGLVLLTLPAVANWALNRDEEWFRMLPWRERWLYLNVARGGTVYQIPMPAEFGSAFAVLPVAALDALYTKDPETVLQAVRHIVTLSTPADWPVLVKAAFEQKANHVDFFDRPIVPRGEIDLMPGSQRSQYSTWLAKTLGDVFPNQVSPRRVDAALRQVFGGVGPGIADAPTAFQRALGLQADKANPRESEPADLPVLGRLFRHGGIYSANNQALIDYWDDLNRYSAWSTSNKQAIKANQPVLQPMSFKEEIYARQLEMWQPVLQLDLQLAARTPGTAERQALYKKAATKAREILKSRPKSP